MTIEVGGGGSPVQWKAVAWRVPGGISSVETITPAANQRVVLKGLYTLSGSNSNVGITEGGVDYIVSGSLNFGDSTPSSGDFAISEGVSPAAFPRITFAQGAEIIITVGSGSAMFGLWYIEEVV